MVGLAFATITATATTVPARPVLALARTFAVGIAGSSVPSTQTTAATGGIIGSIAAIGQEIGGHGQVAVIPRAKRKRRLALENHG